MFNSELFIKRYNEIRNQTVGICKPLAVEDFVAQPIVDVSPPKWHLGHTTWFFETFVLMTCNDDYKEFDNSYGYLFNSYYEGAGERVLRPNRGNMTRPTLENIIKYREYVDQAIGDLLSGDSFQVDEKIAYLLELGLQHEQQHQELLVTDIKYILGNNPLFPVYKEFVESEDQPDLVPAKLIEIEEGIYEMGYKGDGFFFDNERGVHKVYINPFRFQDRLVTNGEYLEFMNDGGYSRFKFWLSEGWEWVNKLETHAPLYWHKIGNKWFQYTMAGLEQVNEHEPVSHVSYFEAEAFARWKSMRLLTEFEWEVASEKFGVVNNQSNFVENEVFRTMPPVKGNNQLFGDAWEWTGSAYLPYPHFKIAGGAIGEYNGKFMINQMVLRGGSCATPRSHIRSSYRNFFHPHHRWQFTGIRLAESID